MLYDSAHRTSGKRQPTQTETGRGLGRRGSDTKAASGKQGVMKMSHLLISGATRGVHMSDETHRLYTEEGGTLGKGHGHRALVLTVPTLYEFHTIHVSRLTRTFHGADTLTEACGLHRLLPEHPSPKTSPTPLSSTSPHPAPGTPHRLSVSVELPIFR